MKASKVYTAFAHPLLLALVVQLCVCTTHTTYHIFPTCPKGTECHTLLDAANEHEKYFATNTTLILHPGDHNLHQRSLILASITGLTIKSCGNCTESTYSSTRIQCTGTDPSFSFFGVSDLRIMAISFISCKLEFHSTQAELLFSTYENGVSDLGGAIAVYNGSNLRIAGNTMFINNKALSTGGAVSIDYSNLTFSGSTTFLGNKADTHGGAVYAEDGCTFNFEGNTVFINNTAYYGDGGAVFTSHSNSARFEGHSTFLGNAAANGGALLAGNSNSFNLEGNTTFLDNTARVFGGAVLARDSNSFTVKGNTTFFDNTAGYGGAMLAGDNNSISFDGSTTFFSNKALDSGSALFGFDRNSFTFERDTTFLNNTAVYSGTVSAWESNTFTFKGSTSFLQNTAYDGGAVDAWYRNGFTFEGMAVFLNNTAHRDGGAVYAREYNTLSFNGPRIKFTGAAKTCEASANMRDIVRHGYNVFTGNTAVALGGAISSSHNNTIIICGSTNILENKGIFGGGIYVGRDSNVFIAGNIKVWWNTAMFGGGIFVTNGQFTMHTFASGTFISNSALGNLPGTVMTNLNSGSSGFGGAIHAIGSTINLNGTYYLIANNTATYGGGFALSSFEGSTLNLHEHTTVAFIGNTATSRGGAIHIEDNRFTYCISDKEAVQIYCFFRVSDRSIYWSYTDLEYLGNLRFVSNTATESGGTLYGGQLEECDTNYFYYDRNSADPRPVQGTVVFQELTNNDTSLDIASDPIKVCICDDSTPKCNRRSGHYVSYPGQTLSISVVAVGQMDGVVPSVIRAVPTGLNLTSEYTTQPTVHRECTELHYPILSDSVGRAALTLYSDKPCSTSGYRFAVNISILPCPTGFSLADQQCICEERLREYTEECHIGNETITRREGNTFWVGLSTSQSGLILHPHCPFDYCTDSPIGFSLNETDTQCQEGRSGVLCGACKSGYSLALGSSRCISNCPDSYLALLMAFVAAGVALVLVLLVCNLTVANGTLSGLIFYANILAINQSVFFPSSDPNISTNVLTVFIAWLNLDFGIETCFFTSMDIYIRMWLQFVFPLYIWVLVGIVVFLAHFNTTIARLMTNTNPVAVLATLFLLSYTKLLRAIMVAFSFTTLSYPDDKSKVVWLYDGNIEYGEVKHLILLLVSLLFLLVLFLPYTLLFLCGQWIQRHLQLKFLSSVKRLYLKAIFDAYYAPYKDKHRYWTGLLLVVRFLVLLLSTAVNIGSPQDPHTNLLVMIIILSGLLAWIGHGVYRKWYLDVLETSFLFNLIVLCAGTYQVRQSLGNQAALAYTSVSVAFVTFVMIVISAVMQRLRVPHYGKSFAQKMKSMKISNDTVTNDPHEEATEPPRASTVSTTVVDINSSQQSDSANYRETVVELM